MRILYSSLSATILIAVIALIRGAALHWLPKNAFRILWIGAAVRLLLPFSIEFQYSFFTLLRGLLRRDGRTLPSSSALVGEAGGTLGGASGNAFPALEVLWLAGFCLMVVFFLASYIRSMGRFRRAVPVNAAGARILPIKLPPRVRIRQLDGIGAPLTYGILRPVILLPCGVDWGDPETLSVILAHESTHIQRHDCLVKLLITAALCAHWFNPAVWLLCRLANRDMELACDGKTIRSLGEGSRFSYARVLLCQAEKTPVTVQLFSHFVKHGVEERVTSALKQRRPSPWREVLACLIVAVTLAVFGTAAESSPEVQVSGNVYAMERILSGESCVSICFGSYSDDPVETFDQLNLTTPEGKPYRLKAQQYYIYQLTREAFEQGIVNGQVMESTPEGKSLFITNASTKLCLISLDPVVYQIGELTTLMEGENP